MHIHYLADRPELILLLAQNLQKEFGYLLPNRTEQDCIDKMHLHCNKDKLPLTLLLFDQEALVGSVSLRSTDLDTHKHFGPWLASLFVVGDYRNQGMGALLVQIAIFKAVQLGFRSLYLFTHNQTDFYAKRGWSCVEKNAFNNYPITIMKYDISI